MKRLKRLIEGIAPVREYGAWSRGILVLLIVLMMIIHGLWPALFVVDRSTGVFLFLVVLLVLAPILKSAKLLGGMQFDFRENLKIGEMYANELERKAMAASGTASEPKLHQPGLFDIPRELRELALVQPGIALSQLRTQIHRGLYGAAKGLAKFGYPAELDALVDFVSERSHMWPEQIALLRVVVKLSEDSLLSGNVTPRDALRVIDIADILNSSFAVGYSLNFDPNLLWEEQGRVCQYEHCIENMPLPAIPRSEQVEWRARIQANLDEGKYQGNPRLAKEFENELATPIPEDVPEEVDTSGACPMFGHFCPGGKEVVAGCETAKYWVALLKERTD